MGCPLNHNGRAEEDTRRKTGASTPVIIWPGTAPLSAIWRRLLQLK